MIFWHPWDPWGRVNSGKNFFWVQTATVLICLKFARFSSDEKSSLSTYVPRRPILPLFDPFSLSVCAVRHPISIQPPFSLYQQVVTWYNGGTFFCSSFFFLLPFFYIKARRASSDRQHCTFDCTVLQETDFFFFLWLIKEGFLTASLFFAVLHW